MVVSLAVPTDVQNPSNPSYDLFRSVDPTALGIELAQASRAVEGMVRGLLLPFTKTVDVQTRRDPDRGMYCAGTWGQEPRICWVGERPLNRADLWSGAVTSMGMLTTPGQPLVTVDPTTIDFNPETGKIRFLTPAVAWFTIGATPTRARITYTGGFPAGSVPEDLVSATILQAALFRNARSEDDTSEDDKQMQAELAMLLAPWNDGPQSVSVIG